ncbi:hypothetical protein ACFVWZ_04735 [Streptomyces sp. NPDC058200]|uniref:hypothetical protein n=1 Tax=Streptomyces sp. NPDC058200 TaxID=3346378 RepID=UPI0036E65EF9
MTHISTGNVFTTTVGATVTVTPSPKYRAPNACHAECGGCGVLAYSEKGLLGWAQAHAESCRVSPS